VFENSRPGDQFRGHPEHPVAADGEQVVVALPGEGMGWVALIDLTTFGVKLLPLGAEPTRVRLTPDGSTALVLSDRAKVAWVLR
jgi:hypothetical protein